LELLAYCKKFPRTAEKKFSHPNELDEEMIEKYLLTLRITK